MAGTVLGELVRQAGLADRIDVSSAGTGNWHVGDRADERALDALSRRGYDGASHRARQYARGWFAEHDLVLALDRSNLADLRRMAPPEQAGKIRLLREFDPQAGAELEVPDPYFGNSRGFDEVLEMVERSCRGLLAHLRETA